MIAYKSARLISSRKRVLLVIGALFYWVVFLLAYKSNIALHYINYAAIAVPGWWLLSMSAFVAVFPVFFLPPNAVRPSSIVMWLLYTVVFVPICIVPLFTLQASPVETTLFTLSVMLAFFFLLLMSQYQPLLSVPSSGVSPNRFTVGMLFISILLVLIFVSAFGFPSALPTLSQVYTVRSSYSDSLDTVSSNISYLIRWSLYIIGPYWFARGLTQRNLLWIAIGIFLQLLIYSITGFKTTIALLGMMIGVAIIIRKEGRYLGAWFIGGISSAILGALLLERFTGNDIASSLLVRRALVTPGLLSGYYFEFFSSNPLAWLANNRYFGAPFRLIGVEYPYAKNIPYVIGAYYFGRDYMSANANLWADAYANFGYLGMLGYSALLGLFLRVYDSVAYRKDYWLSHLLILGPAFALTNSGLLTVMLGHGMLLTIIVLYMSPNLQSVTSNKKTSRYPKRISISPSSPRVQSLNSTLAVKMIGKHIDN